MSDQELSLEVRGRGRPLGRSNGQGGFKHYKPKRWHPEFDLIILDSVAGLSNEEIGRRRGYTPQHISNILSTSQAAEVKEKIRETINKSFEGTIKERLSSIGDKAIKKIESFITDDDNLAAKRPFEFVDRALRIAQSVGSVGSESGKGGNNTVIQGNAIIINSDKADALKNALADSMELDEGVYLPSK